MHVYTRFMRLNCTHTHTHTMEVRANATSAYNPQHLTYKRNMCSAYGVNLISYWKKNVLVATVLHQFIMTAMCVCTLIYFEHCFKTRTHSLESLSSQLLVRFYDSMACKSAFSW